jgi:hypothetical protein
MTAMAVNQQKPLTQSELIVQCWTQLVAESAGAEELRIISDALQERFGTGAVGPAAIARVLADEGVPLRHPEILDFDARWREERLVPPFPRTFETIDDALVVIGKIKVLSVLPEHSKRLSTDISALREEMELIAKSSVASNQTRAIASEVANWLRIWLQNPAIFEDWLRLRRDSPEFLQKFSP